MWSNGSNLANQTDLFEGFYQLTITDALGCSNEFSYFVTILVGNSQITTSKLVLIPNPVQKSSTLNIENTGNELVTLEIFEASGRLLKSRKVDFASFVAPNQEGVYWLRLMDKKGQISMVKLVVY
jgi:hypothetical protein